MNARGGPCRSVLQCVAVCHDASQRQALLCHCLVYVYVMRVFGQRVSWKRCATASCTTRRPHRRARAVKYLCTWSWCTGSKGGSTSPLLFPQLPLHQSTYGGIQSRSRIDCFYPLAGPPTNLVIVHDPYSSVQISVGMHALGRDRVLGTEKSSGHNIPKELGTQHSTAS